jgi:hypothetical protein
MNKKKTNIIAVGIVVIALVITGTQCISAGETEDTELQISSIKGGLLQVSMDIENIGSVTAENITSSILVTGGIFNKINVYHECSGCGSCGTTLEPGEIKTESTLESGIIFGFGPITVDVTADASNADMVTASAQGFVIGFFVLIQ